MNVLLGGHKVTPATPVTRDKMAPVLAHRRAQKFDLSRLVVVTQYFQPGSGGDLNGVHECKQMVLSFAVAVGPVAKRTAPRRSMTPARMANNLARYATRSMLDPSALRPERPSRASRTLEGGCLGADNLLLPLQQESQILDRPAITITGVTGDGCSRKAVLGDELSEVAEVT